MGSERKLEVAIWLAMIALCSGWCGFMLGTARQEAVALEWEKKARCGAPGKYNAQLSFDKRLGCMVDDWPGHTSYPQDAAERDSWITRPPCAEGETVVSVGDTLSCAGVAETPEGLFE